MRAQKSVLVQYIKCISYKHGMMKITVCASITLLILATPALVWCTTVSL